MTSTEFIIGLVIKHIDRVYILLINLLLTIKNS
jgi:hypothetical protein